MGLSLLGSRFVSGKGCLWVSDVSLPSLLSCWDLEQAWDMQGMVA